MNMNLLNFLTEIGKQSLPSKNELLLIIAKSKIREKVTTEVAYNVALSKPIEALSDDELAIILDAFRSEGYEASIEEFTYYFDSVSVDDLPISYWEKDERAYRTIENLEQLMLQNGYDAKYPILLSPLDDLTEEHVEGYGRVVIDGGHHRLQAVRDLIAEGKLSQDFKIPCLFRFRKDWFQYQRKEAILPLLDYSNNWDQLQSILIDQEIITYAIFQDLSTVHKRQQFYFDILYTSKTNILYFNTWQTYLSIRKLFQLDLLSSFLIFLANRFKKIAFDDTIINELIKKEPEAKVIMKKIAETCIQYNLELMHDTSLFQ